VNSAGPPEPEVAALQQRALALRRAGRPRRALQACREILARVPGRPDVASFAGAIAAELGDLEEAVRLYRAAIAARPDFAEAHYNLGNALRGLGRHEEALAEFRRAAVLRPDLVQAHHNIGSTLLSLGRLEEAMEACRRVLELAPEAPEAHRNLGLALERSGRPEDAAAAYRRVLQRRPDWPVAWSNLSTVLLDLGRAREAAEACDAWLRVEPGCIEALAYKCVALNELGERRARDLLLDFDRFVRVAEIAPPPGYASLREFNRALAAHICAHPTLKVPPEDDPTYHHPKLQLTDELLEGEEGPVADLERIVRSAIEDYRREVAVDPPHPFLATWPRRWRLSAWSVVLNGAGNLVPHIHLDGYLGGVYYVEMPDVVADEGAGQAGWFELGRPPAELRTAAEASIRRIQPREGWMILFPSYFYHATVPFESPQRRISFAFDMVPED